MKPNNRKNNLEAEKIYIEWLKGLPLYNAECDYVSSYSYSERREGLFQKNYCRCYNLSSDMSNENRTVSFIKIGLMGCTVLAMHLPEKVMKSIECSYTLTMTELKKSMSRMVLYSRMEEWVENAQHFVETSVGPMAILANPIRLRVQTEKDRHYGKCWDRNGNCTLIGNYGDTTNFYIIGVLDYVKLV